MWKPDSIFYWYEVVLTKLAASVYCCVPWGWDELHSQYQRLVEKSFWLRGLSCSRICCAQQTQWMVRDISDSYSRLQNWHHPWMYCQEDSLPQSRTPFLCILLWLVKLGEMSWETTGPVKNRLGEHGSQEISHRNYALSGPVISRDFSLKFYGSWSFCSWIWL
jgi:hypothetical protein